MNPVWMSLLTEVGFLCEIGQQIRNQRMRISGFQCFLLIVASEAIGTWYRAGSVSTASMRILDGAVTEGTTLPR
jgi:hypothetical protein